MKLNLFFNLKRTVGWFLLTALLAGGLTGCGGEAVTVRSYITEETEETAGAQQVVPEKNSAARQAASEKSGAVRQAVTERNESPQPEEASTESSVCCVYVCGAVVREGVYTLPNGSRAADALEAAGGYAKDALKGSVNLAEKITDGEKLRFPRIGETPEETGEKSGEDPAGKATGKNTSDKDTSDKEASDTRVNINTADLETLKTLPGIGETRAQDILAFREKNGAFSKTEDLMQVPGIKEGTYNKLKDRIRTQ